MTEKKLFGTDGVRGMANLYPLTPEAVTVLGKAIAQYFKKRNPKIKTASIGMDPRLSSSMLSNAVAAGIQSAGIDVVMLGVVPTPLVSTSVVKNSHSFGIVVSASHNPYHDNGIKIFNELGTKLNDKEELEIEALYFNEKDIEKPQSKDLGKVFNNNVALTQYVESIKSFYSKYINNNNELSLTVDCANGAFSQVAKQVFDEFPKIYTKIYNTSPDGININENCGALYPQNLSKKVLENKSNIGVTFDGDGDRFLALDEMGNVVDGDQLIGMAAVFLKSQGKLPGNTVVTTVMSNAGLEKYLKDHGIKLLRSGVGDKYVFEMMKETGSVLGGENSGHIILMDCNPTGDGMAAAMLTISVMVQTGKKLSELTQEIKLFPQVLTKIKVKEKTPLDSVVGLKELCDQLEQGLNGGRIFLRYSGTEAVLRVLAEGPDKDRVESAEKTVREFLIEKLT